MAMLAEPRRKQKWTLNPRGKQWSEDSEKFGQKMLEKMGWSSGKGLGVNEQGVTEHVRVPFKNDTAGIGFKRDGLDEAWTENQDSFNNFLQQLQKSQNNNAIQVDEIKTESNEKSLELKSKQSKARVHYHKFTRGKDVNRYSSKDLANIFGQKELNVNKIIKKSENDNLENSDSDPVGTQDNKGGFITIRGGNMADYFQRKGQNFPLTPRKRIQNESNSESESEYTGFGFASASKEQSNDTNEKKKKESISNYAFENPCLRLGSPENVSNNNNKLEYSKKRKIFNNSELNVSNDPKKFKDDVQSGYKNAFVNAALNLEPTMNEACTGKEFEVSRTQFGVTNSALDLQDEVTDKKKVTFNDHIEYSIDSVKKKKGKCMLDKFEIENKKSKKKKKQNNTNISVSLGIINEALDAEEVSEEINDNEINERKNKKPKKRKSNHQLNLETIVEIPEEDKEAGEYKIEGGINKANENVFDGIMPLENHSNKKVKKKKKKEKIDEKITTINKNNKLNLPETEVDREIATKLDKEVDDAPKQANQEDCYKVKKQKKLKTKNTEIDIGEHENIAKIQIQTNDMEHVKQETENMEEETVKLKRKKKKKSKDKDKKDISTDVIVKLEQEISNKENENSKSVSSSKEEKPKKVKHKESMEDNVESIHTTESIKEKSAEPAVNTKVTHPSSKNTRFNAKSSPRNEKTKMSKKILMSLFYKNSIAHFPGANVEEIKGYGADIYNKE
ncbi:uncharacterized protein LOC116428576 [Nomia melanderi]|uniref:uncharacterized protein LOC116428576 n=1 Tax=Nomia melanderi TaxID=2448451 RepID=UPI003FCD1085